MEWLVLANGDAKGFTKFRVGSVKPEGICGNFDGTEWYAPDMSTVREQLPYRWRKAWDRNCNVVWWDKHRNDSPSVAHLNDCRGNHLVDLYFQPLIVE